MPGQPAERRGDGTMVIDQVLTKDEVRREVKALRAKMVLYHRMKDDELLATYNAANPKVARSGMVIERPAMVLDLLVRETYRLADALGLGSAPGDRFLDGGEGL